MGKEKGRKRVSRLIGLILSVIMVLGMVPAIKNDAYAVGTINVQVTYNPTDGTATVSWSTSVSGVEYYYLWLKNNNYRGDENKYAQVNGAGGGGKITDTSYTIPKRFFLERAYGGKNYKISIEAYDSSGNVIAKGDSIIFQTGIDILEDPEVTLSEDGIAKWVDGYNYGYYANKSAIFYIALYEKDDPNYEVYGYYSNTWSLSLQEQWYDFSSKMTPGKEYYVTAYVYNQNDRPSATVKSNVIKASGTISDILGLKWTGNTLSWDKCSAIDTSTGGYYKLWLFKEENGTYYQKGSNFTINTNCYDFSDMFSGYGVGNYKVDVQAFKLKNVTGSNLTRSSTCSYLPKTSDFYVYITPPVAGEHPQQATVKTDEYSVFATAWKCVDGTKLKSGDVFEEGKQYVCGIYLSDFKYPYDETITGYINDSSENVSITKTTVNYSKMAVYLVSDKFTATKANSSGGSVNGSGKAGNGNSGNGGSGSTETPKNKLVTTDGKSQYYKEDGTVAKSEWVTINNIKYYFNADGYNASNEWRDGKWISADGTCTYEGELVWKSNSTGWWVEDTKGWYPVSSWQKIDGVWYYFTASGYMASNEYYNGYWFNSDGSWDPQYFLTWKSNSTGWWVEDKSGWWPSSKWLKIDGSWYYFDASGYMVTSQYVDGYWIGSDGVCQ